MTKKPARLCKACGNPETARYHYWADEGTAACREDRAKTLRRALEAETDAAVPLARNQAVLEALRREEALEAADTLAELEADLAAAPHIVL